MKTQYSFISFRIIIPSCLASPKTQIINDSPFPTSKPTLGDYVPMDSKEVEIFKERLAEIKASK